MISRRLKAFYYALMRYPMRLNAWAYRRFRAPRAGEVKVHLGPGQKNYLEGWINVDANCVSARIDVWANFLDGLPFHDRTVDVFYSHHVIEHLPDLALLSHFREMHRCLKPGGIIRVGGPNGDSAAMKLIEGDAAWFSDFPDNRKSVGGRFANFILCRGEHLTILTASYLGEVAGETGFTEVRPCLPGKETGYPHLIDDQVLDKEQCDPSDLPHTLVIEARKPALAPAEALSAESIPQRLESRL
ncbi:MAG TPA: methyltransferase domain-containing protein [Gemmataceae bacterium]|nr:methyltransferase domain-containing protein [Gemmataceae bacterium]